MGHTPTPWTLHSDEPGTHVRAPDGSLLMCDEQYYPWAPSVADMAFIVQAVNAHDALVAACQHVIKWFEDFKAAQDGHCPPSSSLEEFSEKWDTMPQPGPLDLNLVYEALKMAEESNDAHV